MSDPHSPRLQDRALRTAIYGLISDRVVSGAPGDWMQFEDDVNKAFDALPAAEPAARAEADAAWEALVAEWTFGARFGAEQNIAKHRPLIEAATSRALDGLLRAALAVDATWEPDEDDPQLLAMTDEDILADRLRNLRDALAGSAAAIRSAGTPPASRETMLHDAAIGLLIAVDNAALEALVDAEDGAPEPEWQGRLWDAADEARAVITPAATPRADR